ncbi:sigma-70 family RNA polymerase sigma factor [Candidatus Poribacteria bacterium]|nr:sigma-70 family RNA polymerase sigma factor [Candidatus Poribacteria bacterium]
MKNVDVDLIQRVLDGDDTAFSVLVEKYQKSVHALAWRKTGDFHIAEDITQETFLKAYQNLSKLKVSQSFASWLYVIATNHSKTWLSKQHLQTQSLEDTDNSELEKATYSSYVSAENERVSVEAQREAVKKLLAKLQESDRTVITLYYLGGMTYEEISKFLGVSVSAIKNRLYRARQFLKKEEPMIREALENYQITPNLTDNIMQEISRIKPTPLASKPLVPWAIAASSAVLLALLLGLGSQHLIRFQQPYSLDAQAEMSVEIVNAPVVLNVEVESDARNQIGSENAFRESENNGQQVDETLLAAADAEGEDVSTPKQQWIQAEPIQGSRVTNFHATLEGDLYVYNFDRGIYKLPANGTIWQSISQDIQLDTIWSISPTISKYDNTLYLLPYNELFASKDEGKTWDLLYSWEERNNVTEFVQTEQALYIAFENGIFKSEDSGKTWKAIHDEKIQYIESLFKIQDTLFVRTYRKLYRLEDDKWQPIEFPEPVRRIISVAASEDKLYAVIFFNWEAANVAEEKMEQGLVRGWWIYRSTDLGNSWKDITPTNAWNIMGWPPDPMMIATGDTLLVMERGMVRSTDGGDTWKPPQLPHTSPLMQSGNHGVALNENTFYVGSDDGLYRSTDAGKSWEMVKFPQDKSRRLFYNIITSAPNKVGQNKLPTLYGIVGVGKIAKTTNNGKFWMDVTVDLPMTKQLTEPLPEFIQIIQSENGVYAKGGSSGGKIRHYKVSNDGYTLVPIKDMPIFNSFELRMHLFQAQNLSVETLQDDFSGATQFFKQMLQLPPAQRSKLGDLGLLGPFAVSGDTFYSEYNFKLFRWEPGNTEWVDTGQEETAELDLNTFKPHFFIPKLAALGDTVYYGKRDGHLVVSFDKGENWVDLTPGLPFKVKDFEDIVFVGSTVYVATDAGILTSDDGRNWQVVTDSDGTNLIMEHLATDGTTLYGITKMTHLFRKNAVFRLENGTWKEIVPSIQNRFEKNDIITSLVVVGNTIYIGTERNGMLHFTLEE